MQQIALEPVDAIRVTTVVDNVTDALLASTELAARPPLIGPAVANRFAEAGESPDMFRAEHGFSVLVTVERAGVRHTILFDTGVSEDGAAENLRRLSVDLRDIEAVVFSHGHFDHTMGMAGIAGALGARNVPLYLHPDAWNERRLTFEGRDPVSLPTPSRSAILGAGFELIEERRPSFLLDGALLVTGEVDRTTDFERGMPNQQALIDGEWTPDPLVSDDQAIVVNLRGRGLVVITGCGHAGMVNILRHARRVTGIDEVYAAMGGFHLSGANDDVIGPTVAELATLSPQVIVPAHCTGWPATHLIAATFPDAFVQNSVGTRFDLVAAEEGA